MWFAFVVFQDVVYAVGVKGAYDAPPGFLALDFEISTPGRLEDLPLLRKGASRRWPVVMRQPMGEYAVEFYCKPDDVDFFRELDILSAFGTIDWRSVTPETSQKRVLYGQAAPPSLS